MAGGISAKKHPITEIDKELIKIGLQVLASNFDDGIYNHTVGCAVLCKNGNFYKGVNFDGIYGSCAEYITIGIAISNGEREFDTIVAVHEKHHNYVIPPCGNCRQVLFEYCPDIKVIVNDEHGNLINVRCKRFVAVCLGTCSLLNSNLSNRAVKHLFAFLCPSYAPLCYSFALNDARLPRSRMIYPAGMKGTDIISCRVSNISLKYDDFYGIIN